MNKNNYEMLEQLLKQAKPDAAMAVEALRRANSTIAMLSNQLKITEALWNEMHFLLATVLNMFNREIYVKKEDQVPLSPDEYAITAEREPDDSICLRLKHFSEMQADDRKDS